MSQTSAKGRAQGTESQETPGKEKPTRKIFAIILLFLSVVLIAGGVFSQALKGKVTSVPSKVTPGFLAAPQLPSGSDVPASVNMGMPGAPTSITTLQGPLTARQMKEFTLVAENALVTLGSGVQIPAWTFNGQAPGPTLRVKQGDLVIVHVINHLSFGITIHWHGIAVPNAEDGVAGVTQDAIKSGQTFTYRFIVNDPGTYWYHSHQLAYAENTGGLFGMLIVDPQTPAIHADVDESVALHEWNGANGQEIFALNDVTQSLNELAQPGQWVRLRIVETSNTDSGNPHLITLVGSPFQVVSLDGHDVNNPQWLNATPVPIGTAQRYDLYFQMPEHGSVALVTANAEANNYQRYQQAPAIVFGQGNVPSTLPPVKKWFDLTTYGQPRSGGITLQSHFDVTSNIVLNNQMGTSLGRDGMTYTINGKVFPNTGMIMVKYGQLVKIHLDNQSDLYHPIHLHGHTFVVLAHNGQALTGSPIRLDTVLVPPHTTYDIAFLANNPGIWMIHCHNFLHANWGMDMMVDYEGYSTPYNVGSKTGNFPD